MALRVLLADESATIKKVMQISLQDYAVEVRAVQLGVDVLQVAQQFKPDIIFIDILLQKKNGYEVSQELKKDPDTRAIPVVLMWSGFMEVDVAKLKASLADGQLEKPFDSDGLRSLIQKFVPKTKTQKLAQHLVFPEVPKIESSQTQTNSVTKTQVREADLELEKGPATVVSETLRNQKSERAQAKPAQSVPEPESEQTWSMDSFENLGDFGKESGANSSDDDEGFKKVGLSDLSDNSGTNTVTPPTEDSQPGLDLTGYNNDEEDSWVQKDLSSFKVDLPEGDDEPIALDFDVPEDDIETIMNTQTKPMARPGAKPQADKKPQAGKAPSREAPVQAAGPTTEQIEKIIREQSQEIIEKIVKRLVPDLASQLIKEEIRRLLDESP